MQIALVSQAYPPDTALGGIATQCFSKAAGLSSLGHKVYVVTHSIDGKRHEINDSGVQVIRIPGFESRIPEMTEIARWLSYSMLVAEELENLLKRVTLDLIDFPEWAAEGFFYLQNRREWSNIPVVIQLHGPLVMFGYKMDWPDKTSFFFKTGTHMEATCVQMADSVYSSSRCSAEWIRQCYHPDIDNIPVIHTGVDTAFFKPLPVKKHKNPTILFIGKLVQNKGVLELAEAAARLSKEIPGLRLRMIGVGDPNVVAQLNGITDRFKAPELLELTGPLSRHALPDELSRAHIFAAPSWYESGPGFVYLEAMACGLPVIACRGSGVEENVLDGRNGFLVQPKNSVELEQKLRKILNDSKSLSNMGQYARKYTIEFCDQSKCLKDLEEYYLTIINQNKSKRNMS